MLLEKGVNWLFVGDSITDCGRARPVGEGAGLGDGYVKIISALLRTCHPELRVCVRNTGVSGNRVRHLRERWDDDVVNLKPNWLTVMIGINDVWRHFDSPFDPSVGTSLDEYESTLDTLLAEVAPRLDGLVVATPFYIEPNLEEPLRAMMDKYGAAAKRVAKGRKALVADTQAAFDQALKHWHPTFIANDRVHPGPHGHAIIAKAILDTVGFRW